MFIFLKKILVFLISFLVIFNFPICLKEAYSYELIPEYLCQIGERLYRQGKFHEALIEFQKALLASPGYKPALEYIQLIQQQLAGKSMEIIPSVKITTSPIQIEFPTKITTRQEMIKKELARWEDKKESIPPYFPIQPSVKTTLFLDKAIETLQFPIEIEKDSALIVEGINIYRFLNISPEILSVDKLNPNQLMLIAKNLGSTYLHIWDSRQRWTLEFLVKPPQPSVYTTYIEKTEEEKEGTFKLRYSLDWSLYESGRRLDSLERISYYWTHWLTLTGDIPYGKFDSSVSVRRLRGEEELSYFTVGLTDGAWSGLKGFSLRGFDFWPGVANLAFSGDSLRGGMFSSPAFEEKLHYTVFGGKEGYGRYTGFSPGLARMRESYVSGFHVNFKPQQDVSYSASVFHGWGNQRNIDLNPFGYDLDIEKYLGNFLFGYEIAYDSDTFAHLFNLNYNRERFNMGMEFRNTSKDFRTMTGWGWRVGEIGLLTNLFSQLTENIDFSVRFDVFRDRLYPNPENTRRLNQDLDIDITQYLGPLTSLRYDYSFENELGRISPLRMYSVGVGFYHTFESLKKLSSYVNYRYREANYLLNPTADYITDKIITGLRFNLLSQLYYFLNKEFDWVESRYNGIRTRPSILETGIDWYEQIFNSPFWINMRILFHDEEETESPFSFLAGEDYFEGFAEISYRPKPDIEAFVSARTKNIWQENPLTNKRIDLDFYGGIRCFWDTGIQWQPVGIVDGYVFKDFNNNGLRENDEPPIEKIRILLGGKRDTLTDIFGYFRFEGVRAKKIEVSIDTSSIPSGFVLTTPAVQQVLITQGMKTSFYFGLIADTQINGFVFEDVDLDGKFGPKDKPLRDAVLVLEDGTRAKTDETGRYSFNKLRPGIHKLVLDLKTIPVFYLPTVEVIKDIELTEGAHYVYSFPLKRITK